MKSIVKLLLLSFLACLVSCAVDEGHAKKREIEAMLRKKDSYAYNLVGERLLRPIDDALLKRLLEHPEENDQHDYVLHSWLLRIAAESDRKYLWILEQEKRRYSGDPERKWIANILLAYDYNVNGNQQAAAEYLADLGLGRRCCAYPDAIGRDAVHNGGQLGRNRFHRCCHHFWHSGWPD